MGQIKVTKAQLADGSVIEGLYVIEPAVHGDVYMLIEKWVKRLSKRGSKLDGEWDLGRIPCRLCYCWSWQIESSYSMMTLGEVRKAIEIINAGNGNTGERMCRYCTEKCV